MIFDVRERQIRATLRKLSRQRVALVLQPHNVWVIEKALPRTEDNEAALRTCYMRGWIESVHEAIPSGALNSDGSLAGGKLFTTTEPMFRLTDSGWAVINRSHMLTILAVFLAALSIIVAVGVSG